MTNFIKFPSIENSYQQKTINHFLNEFPDMNDQAFEITEKLDGCNFGIIITANDIRYQRRTDILKPDEKFNSYQETVARYMDDIKTIQSQLNTSETVHLFCEMIGNKINGRVKYIDGNHNELRLLDVFVNGKKQTKANAIMTLAMMGLKGENSFNQLQFTKQIQLFKNLDEALKFDTRINSLELNIENNLIEGVVIQPFWKVLEDKNGAYFVLKTKNKEFMEHPNKKIATASNSALLNNELVDYVNDNRIMSIFSKHGQIESNTDISKYIKLVQADIIEDAERNGVEDIPNKIKKVGNQIAILLKKYL